MKTLGLWMGKVAAGCVLCVTAVGAFADSALPDVKLTDEQRRLLMGYHQPTSGSYDLHSLDNLNRTATPLVSLQFTAETNLMKGNSLELGAQYSSWSLNPGNATIDVTTMGTRFTLQAPIQQALDFSKSIRDKVELCPEKIIDKMVIDGAVAIHYNW